MTARALTEGEIALARTIFGDAIDYPAVRIVNRAWWPLQPRDVAMAPSGAIHFHPRGTLYRDDFAAAPLNLQGLLIHEMTHVWQAQKRGRCYLPLMRHPFCRFRYRLVEGWPLERYGLEQQAEIVRHAFLLDRGNHAAEIAELARCSLILPSGRPITSAASGHSAALATPTSAGRNSRSRSI